MHAAARTPDLRQIPALPPPREPRGGAGRTLRVLVADGNDLYRAGLVRAINASPDLELVADVRGGTSAVAAARAMLPDAALIDYRMSDLDGWSAAVALRAEHPDLRIVLMSAQGRELFDRLEDAASPFDVRTCDAMVDKASSRRELLEHLRAPAPVRPPSSLVLTGAPTR